MTYLISIIVPVYKVEKYLSRCIESIINQTYKNIEIILVDDGSPDKCGEICNDYASIDTRIIVIHKPNGGLSDARNFGLNSASGEYVGFVDSDDYIEKTMYENLLNACVFNHSDISMCGRYDVINDHLIPVYSFEGNKVWTSQEAIRNILNWDNIDSSVCDKLFKRSLFEDISFPINKYNEDMFIMVNLLTLSKKIIHTGKSEYYYYHRNDSITTEIFSERKMDLLEATLKICDIVNDNYPGLERDARNFFYFEIIYLNMLVQLSG